MKNKKILSDTLFLAVASYFGQFLQVIRGFIVARFLEPSMYGYFGGLSLIHFYSAQGHLGILHGMNRSLSIKIGEGDTAGYNEIKYSSFNSIIIISILISILIISYVQLFHESYSDIFVWGVRVFGAVVVLQHMEMLYHSILRAENRIQVISGSKIIFSVLNLLFVTVFILSWGFYGVLVAIVLSRLTTNIFLIIKSKIKIKPRFNKAIVAKMIREGFPVSLLFLTEVFLTSIDRIMIIKFLNTTQLGYYSIGLTICEAISRLPNAIIYTYFPKILEKFGKTKSVASLRENFEDPFLILSILVAFCIGIAYLFIFLLIENFLPSYRNAIPASRYLIFSVYFIALYQMATRILITIKKNKILLFLQIIIIMISIALNLLMLKKGYGITGVAIATLISYMLYSLSVLYYTCSMLYLNYKKVFKRITLLLVPFVFTCLLLILINRLYEPFKPSKGLMSDFVKIFPGLVLYATCYLAFSFIFIKKLVHTINFPDIKALKKKF